MSHYTVMIHNAEKGHAVHSTRNKFRSSSDQTLFLPEDIPRIRSLFPNELREKMSPSIKFQMSDFCGSKIDRRLLHARNVVFSQKIFSQ
jgi:hypothetical protein